MNDIIKQFDPWFIRKVFYFNLDIPYLIIHCSFHNFLEQERMKLEIKEDFWNNVVEDTEFQFVDLIQCGILYLQRHCSTMILGEQLLQLNHLPKNCI